ncbi:hypothetical protein [Brevibacillus daliensis]|uniref:hypothetical protein n=1 Tax=Brevibacillus daliensis TaxID=2892995 RepID=UPI001E31DA66|nr:hypothetical protein [Brevibacillus daliensis]
MLITLLLILLFPVSHDYAFEQYSKTFTIASDTHKLSVPIQQIPDLNNYFSSYSSSEKAVELKRIHAESFETKDHSIFFIISYNCGNKRCDNLLLKQKGDSLQSTFLIESSIVTNFLLSPDHSKLLIQFGRNEGNLVLRSSLAVLRTDDLALLSSPSTNRGFYYETIFGQSFTLPLYKSTWIDSSTVEVTIPDLKHVSYEQLLAWQSESQKKKTLSFSFP